MQLINPVIFSNSMLTSSTATESVALWLVGTAYTVGTRVRRDTTHKIYECLVANTGVTPETSIAPVATPKWLEVGATNQYAMFDDKFGTQTTATSTLTVVLHPGIALDSLALLNMIGSQVRVTCTISGGTVVYDKTIPLITDIGVYDWKTYFLAPIVAEADIALVDLLPYVLQDITITITGTGTVAIGNISMGSLVTLGTMEYSPKLGIIDYSQKATDIYGNTVITRRAYSKRFSGRFVVQNTFVDQLAGILASVRSIPVVWIGSPPGPTKVIVNGYGSLSVWGFFKDFEIDIALATISYCTITIEGLV